MPGNDTEYKAHRTYLPTKWKATNIPAGQTTGVEMDIPDQTRNDFVLARKASLISIGILLSEAVTDGLIRFELTKDGVDTGKTVDMTSSSGTEAIWELKPGELVGDKGAKIGFKCGSSAALLPDGTIEAVLYPEVQWA